MICKLTLICKAYRKTLNTHSQCIIGKGYLSSPSIDHMGEYRINH